MDKTTKEEREYNALLNNYKAIREIKNKGAQFYLIALNLSGQRKLLEDRAKKLINKHGYLKALRISRGRK